MTQTAITPTYIKRLDDGSYEFGHVLQVTGKRDKLEKVGVADYAAAQKWSHGTSFKAVQS